MLTLQTLLLTSSLLLLAGMLGSLAWLSALRRAPEPARVEPLSDRI